MVVSNLILFVDDTTKKGIWKSIHALICNAFGFCTIRPLKDLYYDKYRESIRVVCVGDFNSLYPLDKNSHFFVASINQDILKLLREQGCKIYQIKDFMSFAEEVSAGKISYNSKMHKAGNLSVTIDLELKDYTYVEQLSQWLNYLEEKGLKGCFFLTGSTLKVLHSHKSLVERLQSHVIGNHTMSHTNASHSEIYQVHNDLRNLFGRETIYFRAPKLKTKTDTYSSLKELGYRVDSSLFGFAPFSIIIEGEDLNIVEIPLLDGGDYQYFQVNQYSEKKALDVLENKLNYCLAFRPSFSLLLHCQYSSFLYWKKVVEIAVKCGYQIFDVERQVDEYKNVLEDCEK